LKSLPNWAQESLDRRGFYTLVKTVREAPADRKLVTIAGLEVNPMVQLAVGSEVGLFDQTHTTDVLRSGRSVRDRPAYVTGLSKLEPQVEFSVAGLSTLLGNKAKLEELRVALNPARVKALTADQLEGQKIFQAILRAKDEHLRVIEAEEKRLMNELKSLRSKRDNFNKGVNQIPGIKGYVDAARARLSQTDRERLVARWTTKNVELGLAPLPAYLEEARVLLNQGRQNDALLSFRSLGSEQAASAAVQRAHRNAFGQGPEVIVPPQGGATQDDEGDLASLGL
jgi:hypothetical protein